MTLPPIREQLKNADKEPVVLRLLAAWCFAASVGFLLAGKRLSELSAYRAQGTALFLCLFGGSFLLFTLLGLLLKPKLGFPSHPVGLPVCFGVYSALTALYTRDFYYALPLTALWAVLIWWYRRRGYFLPVRLRSKRSFLLCAAALGLVFLLLVGGIGVLRVVNFRAPNYDFGIFVQSFYSMRRTLQPVTTVERDMALSHFAVHFSPIFYLFLPVFVLFPSPVTLQLGQAAALGSAVIPLLLICRGRGLSYRRSLLLGFLLLFAPATYMGTNYDFHENCFLLPLLLWVFWAYEKDAWGRLFFFSFLTLLVKEDAFIYLVFFGLYILFDRKKYLVGALLAVFAGLYFVGAFMWLSAHGQGVMTDRYANFLVGDEGLLMAVKTVLTDPGHALLQIFRDDAGQPFKKLTFLLQVFLPLGLLPFTVKHPKRLMLLFPALLMNLLTVYVYQYDLGFQYTFGSMAFLVYLSVVNVSERPLEASALQLRVAAVLCALTALSVLVPNTGDYLRLTAASGAENAAIEETLAAIPAGDSVTASTMLIPRLADRRTLYEVFYHQLSAETRTDWLILDCRYGDYERFLLLYENWGYTLDREVTVGDRPVLLVLRLAA